MFECSVVRPCECPFVAPALGCLMPQSLLLVHIGVAHLAGGGNRGDCEPLRPGGRLNDALFLKWCSRAWEEGVRMSISSVFKVRRKENNERPIRTFFVHVLCFFLSSFLTLLLACEDGRRLVCVSLGFSCSLPYVLGLFGRWRQASGRWRLDALSSRPPSSSYPVVSIRLLLPLPTCGKESARTRRPHTPAPSSGYRSGVADPCRPRSSS